jgi:NAD(P)H-dependent FMN reductase
VRTEQRESLDGEFELIDLLDYSLPHLDEPLPPNMGQYWNPHTQDWAATIGQFDGFVFVTAEYYHATSGVLRNAIDYIYAEWNNKAIGVVSYGASGGTRAAEHFRLVAGELQMADVRTNVALSLLADFKDFTALAPVARTRPKSSTPCSIRSSPGARRSRPHAKSPKPPSRPLRRRMNSPAKLTDLDDRRRTRP